APFIAATATALAVVGAVYRSWWTTVPAGLAAAGAIVVVVRVCNVRVDLTGVLGDGWEDRITPRVRRRMVQRWWIGPIAKSPQPRLRRDVPFAILPGAGRVLRCDVWRPPARLPPSRC